MKPRMLYAVGFPLFLLLHKVFETAAQALVSAGDASGLGPAWQTAADVLVVVRCSWVTLHIPITSETLAVAASRIDMSPH